MKRVLLGALTTAALVSSMFATEGAIMFGAKGMQEEKVQKIIEDLEAETGFVVSDPHERINDAYVEKYGSTTLDLLSFYSIANNVAIHDVITKYPKIGAFTPFNLYPYKMKEGDTTWIGHLRPCVMADMAGMKDEKLREAFKAPFAKLDSFLKERMGADQIHVLEFEGKLPDEPLMTFEYEFEGSPDDFEWDFQDKFESAFEDKGYIIAGFKNINVYFKDNEMDTPYDKYWVYSLCHFKFSHSVFNDIPEAGLFAPCSVYMYIPKGEKKMYVGMPKLENWIVLANITDKKKIEMIRALDKEITETFKELAE